MEDSYTKNYIKIYFWQGVSLILNFLSMFIVIPYLTSNPDLYGVYTICISASIFLAYADLGFINAGQKYAAEYYSQGNIIGERKVIGFSGFILFLFLLLFILSFLLLSLKPELLISGLRDGESRNIASALFIILAFSTPLTLFQRVLQMICGIRLVDFIMQRTNTVASLIKIVSVFWFFKDGEYNIVSYFFFTQVVNLLALCMTAFIIKKQFNYDFISIFKSFKFNSEIYQKSKNLAFTSLFMTIAWIIYYELDSVVIGKIFGANQVAIYAIGLTLLSFIRSILGILFSPFNARFNHFVGKNDLEGLRSFYLQVVIIFAPLIVLPLLTVYLLASPLVLSWVGADYLTAVDSAKFLILCNLFAFIAYPTGILLMATEQLNRMYFINTILPFIFWVGIFFSYEYLGLLSFAVFKMIAFMLAAIAYSYFMLNYIKISFVTAIKLIFKPLIIPVCFIFFSAFFINKFLHPADKSKGDLFITLIAIGTIVLISFIIQYFFSERLRQQVLNVVKKIKI